MMSGNQNQALRVGNALHVLMEQSGVVMIGHQLVGEVHRLHRRRRAEPVAAQNSAEGFAEIRVERVDDRVERWIGPSEPHEDVKSCAAHAQRVSKSVQVTERHDAVEDEKGQPAEHKHPHDDGKRF